MFRFVSDCSILHLASTHLTQRGHWPRTALLTLLLATHGTSASAQNPSGLWKSDQHGYAVVITQQDNAVQVVADEEFGKQGYQTVRAGDQWPAAPCAAGDSMVKQCSFTMKPPLTTIVIAHSTV